MNAPVKMVAQNRKAHHYFQILETLETGLQLKGTEVKSIREGNISLDEAFITVYQGELQLVQAYVKEFEKGNQFNHPPTRRRRLLAHKREILKLKDATEKKGLTIIPLKIYFKGSWAKLLIGVARHKNARDKRQDSAKRDAQREIARSLKVR